MHQILSEYTSFFNFTQHSFISSLRAFFKNVIIENDVEKINSLLKYFARKFYDDSEEKNEMVFRSADSVVMLSFATVILDLEINYGEKHDIEAVRDEFLLNVKGLNEGWDFSRRFVEKLF